MALSEEKIEQLKTQFEWVIREARRQKIHGYRAEDQSAWYSPQRDMFNQMLNIIQSAAAVFKLLLSEEDEKKIGNFPLELIYMVQGGRGGVLCIPSLIDRYMQQEPEAVTKFLTMIGYTTLFTYAILPASTVNPEGILESDIRSDLILTTAMGYLEEKTRDRVKEDLEIWKEELATPAMFSDRMVKLSEALSALFEPPETTKGKTHQSYELE